MCLKKSVVLAAGLMLAGLVSCSMWDHERESLTAPMAGNEARPENFVISTPTITDWDGVYVAGKSSFSIKVPVIGALKITYRLTSGAQFALFVETSAATKMEIGLMTFNGVTDVLDTVYVTYADGVTAFASMPADIVKVTQSKAIHYQRKNVPKGDENWWPVEAAFGFGVPDAQLNKVYVVRNGVPNVGMACQANPTEPCQVKQGGDSGQDSLRCVLSLGTCSTVTFAPGVTEIQLTTGYATTGAHLTIANSLTIDGGSGVTIRGNNSGAYVVFKVNSGVTAVLNGLTITGGNAGPVEDTGGILNDGTLTLGKTSTVSQNTGTGIVNTGTLTIDGTVSGNTAAFNSGGISNHGTLTINGTVSGNTAGLSGGGINNVGGTLTINGTVSGNTAGLGGGGILNSGGTVIGATAVNVSGNTATTCNNYYNYTTATCILP